MQSTLFGSSGDSLIDTSPIVSIIMSNPALWWMDQEVSWYDLFSYTINMMGDQTPFEEALPKVQECVDHLVVNDILLKFSDEVQFDGGYIAKKYFFVAKAFEICSRKEPPVMKEHKAEWKARALNNFGKYVMWWSDVHEKPFDAKSRWVPVGT